MGSSEDEQARANKDEEKAPIGVWRRGRLRGREDGCLRNPSSIILTFKGNVSEEVKI